MAVNAPILIKRTDGYQSGRTSVDLEYQVETTSMDDSLDDVALAVTSLPIDGSWIVVDLRCARRKEHPLWWDVTARIQEMIWPDNQPIPTARASMLSSSYDEQSEAYFIDSANQTVTNSAYELFETFPTRLTGNPILQIEKNFESYSMVAFDAIKYTLNASAITIKGTTYAAKTLLFKPPTVQEMVENVNGIKYDYFRVTFRLAGDANLHVDDIEDRGYCYLLSGVQAKISLSNTTLEFPNTPYPLDGDGNKCANASYTPAIMEFYPYAAASWGIDFD